MKLNGVKNIVLKNKKSTREIGRDVEKKIPGLYPFGFQNDIDVCDDDNYWITSLSRQYISFGL